MKTMLSNLKNTTLAFILRFTTSIIIEMGAHSKNVYRILIKSQKDPMYL